MTYREAAQHLTAMAKINSSEDNRRALMLARRVLLGTEHNADERLIRALKQLSVETGSLACLGCGYEHRCSTQGCRIIRGAIEHLRGDAR